MADYQPLQASFAFGEMSPRLLGRSNTERYQQSVKTCENVLTFSHGNAIKRPGTKYLETSPSTGNIRLIDFQIDKDIAYVLELGFKSGAGYIRLLDRDGYVDDPGSPGTPWEAATGWADDAIPEISYAPYSVTNILYLVHPSQPPKRLTINTVTPSYTFTNVSFTTPPPKWAASDYPSAVTFHQQRLWFASTPSYPDYLWGSKPIATHNFDFGSAGPADAIEFQISSRVAIQWIHGFSRDLLIGADFGEFILTSEGGVLIPGDLEAKPQSSYGSAKHSPASLGNGVLYLGSDKRRIRFMNYQFVEDGWVSVDITWPSEHITRGLVKELHFKYAPDPFLWACLEDGTIISAIYEREQENLVGWHRHPMPLADVKSITLTKTGPATELWVAAERTINSVVVRYIERTSIDCGCGSVELSDLLTDCSIETTVTDVGDGTFTVAVPHLEGEEIQIIIEGAVHKNETVTGGIVTLQEGFEGSGGGAEAVVGLPYTGKLYLLPLEGVNRSGTAMAIQKRYNKIFARISNSAVPVINGQQPNIRFPITFMGQREDLFTGDIQIENLGWDRFAEIEIEMPFPLPYNVVAIFGQVGTGKL